jgi:hypothetical protein
VFIFIHVPPIQLRQNVRNHTVCEMIPLFHAQISSSGQTVKAIVTYYDGRFTHSRWALVPLPTVCALVSSVAVVLMPGHSLSFAK